MSNKTQLQTNNTALDGYIARINAAKEVAASLPDASGGGSIETCTLNITNNDNGFSLNYLACETLQDGVKVLNILHDGYSLTGFNFSVSNVICGSFFYCSGYSAGPMDWITDNVLLVHDSQYGGIVFQVTAPANGIASVDLIGDS